MLSCVQLFATPWTVACQAPLFTEFSRQEYWSGLPFPSPGGVFPTQGSNLSLLHCRQILYHLSHQVSPQYFRYMGLNQMYIYFTCLIQLFILWPGDKFKCPPPPTSRLKFYFYWTALVFFFFWLPCCLWDLSSLTRDRTCAPCSGNTES